MEAQKSSKPGILKKLRTQFIAGILLVVPIGFSVLVLIWVFQWIDNILQPIYTLIFNRHIPGIGFITAVIIIYLAGVIATNIVGKRIIRWGDSLLARVPIFRQLYTGVRQILQSFTATNEAGFTQVVLVEFPSKGMRTIGFVTSELTGKSGEKLFNVFIPQVPTPTTGFLQIMREKEIIRTEISIEDALRMVISAGSVTPRGVYERL